MLISFFIPIIALIKNITVFDWFIWGSFGLFLSLFVLELVGKLVFVVRHLTLSSLRLNKLIKNGMSYTISTSSKILSIFVFLRWRFLTCQEIIDFSSYGNRVLVYFFESVGVDIVNNYLTSSCSDFFKCFGAAFLNDSNYLCELLLGNLSQTLVKSIFLTLRNLLYFFFWNRFLNGWRTILTRFQSWRILWRRRLLGIASRVFFHNDWVTDRNDDLNTGQVIFNHLFEWSLHLISKGIKRL